MLGPVLGMWDDEMDKQTFFIIDSNVFHHSLSSLKAQTTLVNFKHAVPKLLSQ